LRRDLPRASLKLQSKNFWELTLKNPEIFFLFDSFPKSDSGQIPHVAGIKGKLKSRKPVAVTVSGL